MDTDWPIMAAWARLISVVWLKLEVYINNATSDGSWICRIYCLKKDSSNLASCSLYLSDLAAITLSDMKP